jgi:hypothetical protein
MNRMFDRGITLVECLVALVAGSVILGGMASLYMTADLAARSNATDIHGVAVDYNLDRVLAEIATATTAGGTNPTRRAYSNTVDSGTLPSAILVYERPRSIRSTVRFTPAQGGPSSAKSLNNVDPRHPFPVFFDSNVLVNPSDRMTNVSPTRFPDNWVTGIIALHRRDPDNQVPPRFRIGILWHAELTMRQMVTEYGLPQSFVRNAPPPGSTAYPTAMTEAAVIAMAAVENPHLIFAGTRVLGVGVQSFEVNGHPRSGPDGDPSVVVEPMRWQVKR